MAWTYVSMVYSAGTYGDGAAATIQSILRSSPDICLAVVVRIPSDSTDADYNDVVNKLAADSNARVVMSYLQGYDQLGLFAAVQHQSKMGWFLWLSGDTMSHRENHPYIDVIEGSLYVDLPEGVIPGFQQYVWSFSYSQSQPSNDQVLTSLPVIILSSQLQDREQN